LGGIAIERLNIDAPSMVNQVVAIPSRLGEPEIDNRLPIPRLSEHAARSAAMAPSLVNRAGVELALNLSG
jgi:hypothetical protein